MTKYILVALATVAIIRYLKNRNSNVKRMSGQEALSAHSAGISTFIDVRTPTEIAHGKLAGAKEINITSSNFKTQIEKLDKNQPYIVYCRSGMRSARACRIMEQEGFTDVTNVAGGYLGMK